MVDYKWAQIHFSRLKSPVTDYFPASLVKYLVHGGGEDTLKPVNESSFDNEDYMDDMDGPAAEDYAITPSGRLGGKYAVSQYEGKFLGEFAEMHEAIAFIKAKMEKDQFWPNVWFVDDHGGVQLVKHWED